MGPRRNHSSCTAASSTRTTVSIFLALFVTLLFFSSTSFHPLTVTTFVDGSYFLSSNGIELDAPLNIPTVDDVTQSALSLQQQLTTQSMTITQHRTSYDNLVAHYETVSSALNQTQARVEEQVQRALEQQYRIDDQRLAIEGLENYTIANSVVVAKIEDDARALAERTTQLESTTTSIDQQLIASRLVADGLASRALGQGAFLVEQFRLTAAQTMDLASLQAQDALLADYSRVLQADAYLLRQRVNQSEAVGLSLKQRQDVIDSDTIQLTHRLTMGEASVVSLNTTTNQHTSQIAMFDATVLLHTNHLDLLTAESMVSHSNISILEQHDLTHSDEIDQLQADATALTARVTKAEQLEPSSSSLVNSALDLTPILDTLDSTVTSQQLQLSTTNTTWNARIGPNIVRSNSLGTQITSSATLLDQLGRQTMTSFGTMNNLISQYTDQMVGLKSPRLYRYTFTSNTQWTVPAGVVSAFVTMAGGGSSGYGWSMLSPIETGHSGGYIMNQPIQITGGQVLTMTIGRGGRGAQTYPDTYITDIEYWAFSPPAGEDGLAGYPGTATTLTDSSGNTIMSCGGGSGPSPGQSKEDKRR